MGDSSSSLFSRHLEPRTAANSANSANPSKPTADERAIAALIKAGYDVLADLVARKAMRAHAALVAAGLRAKPAPTPKPKTTTPLETALHSGHDRVWLELDADDAAQLDATEGDTIAVTLNLEPTLEGPPDRVEMVGIAGTRHRVWLSGALDVETVQSVTIKRQRRV